MVTTVVSLREKGEIAYYEIDRSHLVADMQRTKGRMSDVFTMALATGDLKLRDMPYEEEVDQFNAVIKVIGTIKKHGKKLSGDAYDPECHYNVDTIMAHPPKPAGPTMHM